MNREYVRVLRRVSSAVENPGTGIWSLGEVYLRRSAGEVHLIFDFHVHIIHFLSPHRRDPPWVLPANCNTVMNPRVVDHTQPDNEQRPHEEGHTRRRVVIELVQLHTLLPRVAPPAILQIMELLVERVESGDLSERKLRRE